MNLLAHPSILCVGLAAWLSVPGDITAAPSPSQLTVTRQGDEITLTWESVPGWHYQMYSSACLNEPWKETTDQPLLATGYSLSYQTGITDQIRLYRVAKVAPEAAASMVWIPRGTFTMGSPPDEIGRDTDEGPQMEVTISHGFWMGQSPVTQAEFEEVMGYNPSFFNGVRDWPAPNTDYGSEPARPVESVSWEDALAYCAALTQRERQAGRIGPNLAFRLPTEAEWEYACRAGTDTRFSHGDDLDYGQLAEFGWYDANSNRRTHPVGMKQPNPWGLYDMHGHVWEWCLDWHGPYPGGSVVDPQGPATGLLRVIRGGTFANVASWTRSANRDSPRGATFDFGFRVVLASETP